MFTTKELKLVHTKYFNIIQYQEEDDFIVIQSRNTKDSWIIKKIHSSISDYPIVLYHKHPGQRYYHRHWQCYTVLQTVNSIKSHDEYSKTRKWNSNKR